ncbi:hypothetical protein A2483_03000 [Candidatus Peregrinibacteria bacterium RIFOXYC2_FULL_33_13]|nr:MAG: hypothetical protein UR30_C0012G0002 [Candidatus Peregrinibacteria bacterium GW2011_GWC2_33_13]OGJ54443.1 MAG: hypothetical protein A2483_03000 [Candidatus Peregrinibacteria bacterium RIFOXYC2_FULL_33_13]
MNEKFINRPKNLDDAIEIAKKTPGHAVKFNARKWSITVIVEKDGEVKEFEIGEKKDKKKGNAWKKLMEKASPAEIEEVSPDEIDKIVYGDNNNWLHEFADAGLLRDESRDEFMKRIKKFRKNSPIIKLPD